LSGFLVGADQGSEGIDADIGIGQAVGEEPGAVGVSGGGEGFDQGDAGLVAVGFTGDTFAAFEESVPEAEDGGCLFPVNQNRGD